MPPRGLQVHDGSKICLLPRLALCDLIALSGLVHHLAVRCQTVMVVAHRKHVSEVKALYGEAPNVRFTFVHGWNDLYGDHDVLTAARGQGYEVVPLGSVGDCCPYRFLGVDPSELAGGFRLTRRLADEQTLHERIVREVGPKYVVVHDDEGRRIRDHLLPAGVPVVRVRDPRWRRPSAFEWIQAMDGATEVHAINSCFAMLAGVLAVRAPLVLHAYASPCGARVRHSAARVIYG